MIDLIFFINELFLRYTIHSEIHSEMYLSYNIIYYVFYSVFVMGRAGYKIGGNFLIRM